MKKSGFRTTIHIYILFLLVLAGITAMSVGLFLMMITVQGTDGKPARSDWPRIFTDNFKEEIVFVDGEPKIKQSGMDILYDSQIGIQILDPGGREIYSFQKPDRAKTNYSGIDLLNIDRKGSNLSDDMTLFAGGVTLNGDEYAYILYFPVRIEKITMYLNGAKFTGGKTIAVTLMVLLLAVVVISGIVYGFIVTEVMGRLIAAVGDIANRCYLPKSNKGAFGDLYRSLNMLNEEIRSGDELRNQTDRMKEEWIANITHDLKTPLSPVKGYAEMLCDGEFTESQCREYARIMLKNADYMESLIDDLKLTYQFKNGIVPVNRHQQNMVRFIKELVIDILNDPKYQKRSIDFESADDVIMFDFDVSLMKRALQNIIINAFVHGKEDTEVMVQVAHREDFLCIFITDNGLGMSGEEADKIFERYHQGTNTGQTRNGTGLGLAIAKDIVEIHGGRISILRSTDEGTIFEIIFSDVKVN